MGSGIVQFKDVEEGGIACEKFTGYVYGGRPLGKSRSVFETLKGVSTISIDGSFWRRFSL